MDPQFAGGVGPFNVLKSDASKLPYSPIAGVLVKNTPLGAVIKGVLIPPSVDSMFTLFKPDYDGMSNLDGMHFLY